MPQQASRPNLSAGDRRECAVPHCMESRVTHSATIPRKEEPKAFDLLQSKLHVPWQRQALVERTELVDRLSRARDRRVVSVVAPPGYG